MSFEEEIHYTLVSNKVFKKGEKVCIAISGGKDSTVLAHVLNKLNIKYNYGLDLFFLAIDEGIKGDFFFFYLLIWIGYRDDSIETVKRNEKFYNIPLTILSYKDLYGWTMDEIVKYSGLNNNCTYCGVLRR